MANIFVNGMSAKAGGGKSILNNYLQILKERSLRKNTFFVLTPDKDEYLQYSNESIRIIEVSSRYKRVFMFPWVYQVVLPRLMKKLKIDVIFNLADIPIAAKKIPQVFLFDWPYAVYPNSPVWNMMDLKSYLTRKAKLYFFKRNLKYVSTMIAQTDTMKKRLEVLYSLKNIVVISNPVPLENIDVNNVKDDTVFKLPMGTRFLYLSHYYSHKNFEILIHLAEEVLKRNLDYKFIITIDKEQHDKARLFLDNIKAKGLIKVIHNLGEIKSSDVPFLFKACDAFFMPSLMESYGLTYIEAMLHGRVIFTSDLDFARDVCGKSAFYFNPLNVNSILNCLKKLSHKTLVRKSKMEAQVNLSNLKSWNETMEEYMNLFSKLN